MLLENGGIIFSFVGLPPSGLLDRRELTGSAARAEVFREVATNRPVFALLKQISIVVHILTRLEPVDVLAQALSRPAIVDPSLDWPVDSCIDGTDPEEYR